MDRCSCLFFTVHSESFTASQRLRFGDFGRRLAPSGEVLAWLLAKGTWNFSQKRVLELGSGLVLAGLASAAWMDCNYVLLSDGDQELPVVDVMRRNIALNPQSNATIPVGLFPTSPMGCT